MLLPRPLGDRTEVSAGGEHPHLLWGSPVSLSGSLAVFTNQPWLPTAAMATRNKTSVLLKPFTQSHLQRDRFPVSTDLEGLQRQACGNTSHAGRSDCSPDASAHGDPRLEDGQSPWPSNMG